ncbi:MAG: hypothetical protein Q4C75_04720, partial [Bergeyella zoohelcum]|nr:hypothetical protein [Bergeyella zoohelcum]
MKQFFTILGIVAAATAYAQNDTDRVYIPDTNFKKELLFNTSIDTNKDRAISYGEARAYKGKIDVSYKQIKDLTGIEAFVNITELYCYNNQLTSLDVSKNTALTSLGCSSNQLTS